MNGFSSWYFDSKHSTASEMKHNAVIFEFFAAVTFNKAFTWHLAPRLFDPWTVELINCNDGIIGIRGTLSANIGLCIWTLKPFSHKFRPMAETAQTVDTGVGGLMQVSEHRKKLPPSATSCHFVAAGICVLKCRHGDMSSKKPDNKAKKIWSFVHHGCWYCSTWLRKLRIAEVSFSL